MKIIHDLGEKVMVNNNEGTITDITTDNGSTLYLVQFKDNQKAKFLAIELEEVF